VSIGFHFLLHLSSLCHWSVYSPVGSLFTHMLHPHNSHLPYSTWNSDILAIRRHPQSSIHANFSARCSVRTSLLCFVNALPVSFQSFASKHAPPLPCVPRLGTMIVRMSHDEHLYEPPPGYDTKTSRPECLGCFLKVSLPINRAVIC
jgi:hypothetical protein